MSTEPEFKYASVDRDEFIGQWVDWVMENQAWPISEDNARRYINYIVDQARPGDSDIEWQIKRLVKLGATDLVGPILHEANIQGLVGTGDMAAFSDGIVDKLKIYQLKKAIQDPKVPSESYWAIKQGKRMEADLRDDYRDSLGLGEAELKKMQEIQRKFRAFQREGGMKEMPLYRGSPDDVVVKSDGRVVLVDYKYTEMDKVPLMYRVQLELYRRELVAAGVQIDSVAIVCKTASQTLKYDQNHASVVELPAACPEAIQCLVQRVYDDMVKCLQTDQPPAPRMRAPSQSLDAELTSAERAINDQALYLNRLKKEIDLRLKSVQATQKGILEAKGADLSEGKVDMGGFTVSKQVSSRTDNKQLLENIKELTDAVGIDSSVVDAAVLAAKKTSESVIFRAKTVKQNPGLERLDEMAQDSVEIALKGLVKGELEQAIMDDLDQALDADEGPGF